MKKLFIYCLCFLMVLGLFPMEVLAAPEWPSNVSIEAEGGIVIDADTGAVIFGKNIHESYFPASITKILTALLVIENCDLDETVTFSQNAVYNVESGSSNMSMDTGDQLSVRDCLYGLMLQSANEVANALAEHVAGTIEDFAVMMNEKAASLGCTDSHFANPSGLNNPEHYTSAYDMSLIARAAFDNKTFVEIDSKTYYKIPPTKLNPEGRTIYAHHAMLKKNDSRYYPGIIGGKTGYTSLAGNTLVTCAEKDGMRLITVVLNGHQTHYTDTAALLNFGFNYFVSVKAADYDTTYTSIDNDMVIAELSSSDLSAVKLDEDRKVTLPKDVDFSNVTSSISYELGTEDPDNAIAKIQYQYNDRNIGCTYLEVSPERTMGNPMDTPTPEYVTLPSVETTTSNTASSTEETSSPASQKAPFKIPSLLITIILIVLAIGALTALIIFLKIQQEKKEEQERIQRRKQRLKRLEDCNYSQADFDLLMAQRRADSLSAKKRRRHTDWHHK